MQSSAHRARPRVTVVVVTWQGAKLLCPCLDSLAAQTVGHDVLVVDNASSDGSADLLRQRASKPAAASTRTARSHSAWVTRGCCS